MALADHGFMRRAGGRWAIPVVLAGACMLVSACGGSFMDDTPETEIPSGCSTGMLGCVTQGNIAAMAARPSDLVKPRREQPRDAARRDAVMAAYRQGATRAPTTGSVGTMQLEGSR